MKKSSKRENSIKKSEPASEQAFKQASQKALDLLTKEEINQELISVFTASSLLSITPKAVFKKIKRYDLHNYALDMNIHDLVLIKRSDLEILKEDRRYTKKSQKK